MATKVNIGNEVYRIVSRKDARSGREIDAKCKNKWNWSWLEEQDKNGEYLSAYIRKINLSGSALCIYCNKIVCYGSSGKKDLLSHSKHSSVHLSNKKSYLQTSRLPASWRTPGEHPVESETCSPLSLECRLPYGVAENVHNTATCPSLQENASCPIYSVNDRKHHLEAYILSFVTENSLPLSSVPKLIEFANFLSRDVKALSKVEMNRTAATYKLKDGLAVHVKKSIVAAMKKYPFSINIDECTSNNNHKVFSLLVSYFDAVVGKCVVQHYESVSMVVVNSVSLFQTICDLFKRDAILFDNLVSDLSDSTNYMRGKKSGLEKRLRDKAPQLLDIDGDICHHVHNTVGVFCKPFEKFVEKLIDDIHWDTKYSTDILDALSQICFILNISFRKPPMRISHRWLSIYDCLLIDFSMIDALNLLYYSWLDKDSIDIYCDDIRDTFARYKLNEEAIQTVKKLQRKMKEKKLTDDGKERKKRIYSKLFFQKNTLLLYSNFYLSVLPMFKSLVLTFEQKEPQVHKLHTTMVESLRNFLGCFIKFEVLSNGTDMKTIKIDSNLRKRKTFYVGDENLKLLSSLKKKKALHDIVTDFYLTVKFAYVNAGTYLQKKYAIDNPLLKYLSALNPCERTSSETHSNLLSLKPFFDTFIHQSKSDYSSEVQKYVLDTMLPAPEENERLDIWWNKVFHTKRYPALSDLVRASLSIFTGPMVECSFSMMNDIIDARSGRMEIDTYNAIMAVKFDLKSSGKSSSSKFSRRDVLRDPVDPDLCYFMRTSSARYKKRLGSRRDEVSNRKKKLSSTVNLGKIKNVSVHQKSKEICKSISKLDLKQALSSASFRIPKVKKVSSTEKSSNIELEKASDNTGKEKLSDSSPVPVVDFEVANLPESRKRPIVDSAEKRNTKQLKLSSFFKTY